MKRELLFLSIFFICANMSAQVSIGDNKSSAILSVKEHKEKDFDLLKKTKTYFVVPSGVDFESFEKELEEIWEFNEIEFITSDDFFENQENYVGLDKSIIRYESLPAKGKPFDDKGFSYYFDFDHSFGSPYLTSKMIFYYCEEEKNGKKGRIKREMEIFSEIFFTANIKLRHKVLSSSMRYKTSIFTTYAKKEDDNNPEKQPGLYNFQLGYIKNYFQLLNDKLVKKESLIIEDGIENKEKLKELKGSTLYVPDWLLKKYNSTKGFLKEIVSPEVLMKEYDFDYKVVPNEEINEKILNGDKFYYLMQTQINSLKIVSVIDGSTGEIIYSESDNMSYNVKDSDIKSISKKIRKS